MLKFGTVQTAARREDVRFLAGRGNYIDDTAPPEALNIVFFRSPLAHADILSLDLAEARDAAELIGFDYEERPVHVALAPGGEELHPEAPDNEAYDWALGAEAATEAAFATADHRVRLRLEDHRVIVKSLEPSGAWAEWRDGRLHMAHNGQGVWELKAVLARQLDLPPEQVRVTTADVGDGFGMKGMTYPEHIAIAHAARALGRPVRRMSERTEAMSADHAGRDLVSEADLALDAGHRIVA